MSKLYKPIQKITIFNSESSTLEAGYLTMVDYSSNNRAYNSHGKGDAPNVCWIIDDIPAGKYGTAIICGEVTCISAGSIGRGSVVYSDSHGKVTTSGTHAIGIAMSDTSGADEDIIVWLKLV